MNALAFPQGTPQDVVDQITKALIGVRQDPQFKADSLRFGLSVVPVGEGETVLKAQQDMARWYLDQLTQLSGLLKTPIPEKK
jgi:tripartite-type tricarboxylate transporter receptor subunit TctC